MALTRVLIPLALLSLLIVIASAENVPYTQNPEHVDNHQQQLIDHGHDDQHHDSNDLLSSTLNDLDVDNLLGNLLDDKQDHNEQHKRQLGQENYVPNYEKTKPYQE